MPLDLKAVVAEKIALDKKDSAERLAAANRRQKEAERGLAERRLLLRYVAEEVEKDQTLVRWEGSSFAHFLVATKRLYMSVCPLVGPLVRWSVGWLRFCFSAY